MRTRRDTLSLDATSEKNQPEAIGLSKERLADLAVEDDQLLPDQSILCDEIGFAARQVGGGAEHKRMAGGLGEMQAGLFKGRNQTDHQWDERMQEGMHVS